MKALSLIIHQSKGYWIFRKIWVWTKVWERKV